MELNGHLHRHGLLPAWLSAKCGNHIPLSAFNIHLRAHGVREAPGQHILFAAAFPLSQRDTAASMAHLE